MYKRASGPSDQAVAPGIGLTNSTVGGMIPRTDQGGET